MFCRKLQIQNFSIPIQDFSIPIQNFSIPIQNFSIPIQNFSIPIHFFLNNQFRNWNWPSIPIPELNWPHVCSQWYHIFCLVIKQNWLVHPVIHHFTFHLIIVVMINMSGGVDKINLTFFETRFHAISHHKHKAINWHKFPNLLY